MQKRFEGKTAVVTGASGGIGAAMAKRFAAEGAAVVVSAIDPRVDDVAASLKASGAKVASMRMDVTRKDEVAALYDLAEKEFGRVDISVQNAGVITIARIEAMTEAEWDKVMAVNTKGVFLCCQEAILRMRKHGEGGRLINTASGQARQGFIYAPHYAASKFGVVGITQSLAKEVAKEKITVNAICPGIILTEMGKNNLGSEAAIRHWEDVAALKRLGAPEDVVGPVLFFASDLSAFVTGQSLNVDGGIYYH